MPRYFVKLAYDGTPFHGWQTQPNANTVQEEVHKALSVIIGKTTEVVGCGRTDTGVHASVYYFHFDSDEKHNTNKLLTKLNGLLPRSIGVYEAYEVRPESHARFDATMRSYEYRIVVIKNPFEVKRAYQFRLPLDIQAMNFAANYLLSISDFSSFCKLGSDAKTTICKVSEAKWEMQDDLLIFRISADRFLRNMVRAIVGTLMDVGLGKISFEAYKTIIEKGNRSEAGTSAPAHGLYLTHVEYPENKV
ncbi:MAG: tRNA pseudouridine(38-40) synthase TruA [Flavobacteriales bacterium]|jgi:tRNA pseudouridine38-40 synthase|nr:tRNA pseudouridine(38-40) synthase TruA [Flavobacteriales bacterium]